MTLVKHRHVVGILEANELWHRDAEIPGDESTTSVGDRLLELVRELLPDFVKVGSERRDSAATNSAHVHLLPLFPLKKEQTLIDFHLSTDSRILSEIQEARITSHSQTDRLANGSHHVLIVTSVVKPSEVTPTYASHAIVIFAVKRCEVVEVIVRQKERRTEITSTTHHSTVPLGNQLIRTGGEETSLKIGKVKHDEGTGERIAQEKSSAVRVLLLRQTLRRPNNTDRRAIPILIHFSAGKGISAG
jgi:hypothetical protein